MIAHVAEASEASGRVLLWLDPGAVSMPQTFDASVRIASAFAADLETVVIDGPSASEIGDVPAAYVSLLGRPRDQRLGLTPVPLARDLLAERQRREVGERAERARVNVSHASAGGDAIDRLAEMCLMRGPWNIVAVSRPPSQELPAILSSILANVSGATGVVVAGRRSAALRPDVAVVVEDAERMPSMLRAADRLVMPGGRIHVMIAAETAAAYDELEAQVRLVTAGAHNCVHHAGGPDYGIPGALDDTLFALRPGFIIARFGGTLLGDTRALSRLLGLAPGPFLLVR
ncbi:MAG: hypothetical protein HOP09_05995 [Hyphomicrobium sp.]|nr:hypothetical protein [Hyphomicrobium sp.]